MFWWYIGAAVFGFMFGAGAATVVLKIITDEWWWRALMRHVS